MLRKRSLPRISAGLSEQKNSQKELEASLNGPCSANVDPADGGLRRQSLLLPMFGQGNPTTIEEQDAQAAKDLAAAFTARSGKRILDS